MPGFTVYESRVWGNVGINRNSTPQVLIVDLLRNLKVEEGEEKCDINDFEDIGGR